MSEIHSKQTELEEGIDDAKLRCDECSKPILPGLFETYQDGSIRHTKCLTNKVQILGSAIHLPYILCTSNLQHKRPDTLSSLSDLE